MPACPMPFLRLKLSLLMVLACLALAAPTAAGDGVWTPAGPPGTRGNNVFDQLVVDPFSPFNFYLGYFGDNSSGVWRSFDGGASWTSINNGLPSADVVSLVADPFIPGRLYAMSLFALDRRDAGDGVWRRTATFDSLVLGMEADPHVEGALWAWSFSRVLRSTNFGDTWDEGVDAGVGDVVDLELHPEDRNILYASGINGLSRSTDRGATWTFLSSYEQEGFQGGFLWVETAPNQPTLLYARPVISSVRPCVRSDNGGASWIPIPFPDPGYACRSIVVDSIDGVTAWALAQSEDGHSFRLYSSTNAGSDWFLMSDTLPQDLAPHVLHLTWQGDFYVMGPEGVYRNSDGGETWVAGNQGITQILLSDLLALPGPLTSLLAAVQPVPFDPEAPLLRSRNSGRLWNELPLSHVSALALDPKDPSRVFAATRRLDDSVRPRLHESRDRGVTWTVLGETPDNVLSIAFHPAKDRQLVIGTEKLGVYQSKDGGRTWQASSAGLPFPPPCFEISCQGRTVPTVDLTFDPRNPNRVWAVFFGKVVRSDNGGWRWTKVADRELRDDRIVALLREPGRQDILYAAGQSQLFKSLNGGASWFPISRGLGRLQFTDLAFDPRQGSALYAASVHGGVLRSRDHGNTWERLNTGLPILDVRLLEINPNVPGGLFAVTGGAGVWQGNF